jgi:hypothetical protein
VRVASPECITHDKREWLQAHGSHAAWQSILDKGGGAGVSHAHTPDAVEITELTHAGNRLGMPEQAAVAVRRYSQPLCAGRENELIQQLASAGDLSGRPRPRPLSEPIPARTRTGRRMDQENPTEQTAEEQEHEERHEESPLSCPPFRLLDNRVERERQPRSPRRHNTSIVSTTESVNWPLEAWRAPKL